MKSHPYPCDNPESWHLSHANVTRATGILFMRLDWCRKYQRDFTHIYFWFVHLDKQLSLNLNLSMHELYFSSGSGYCNYGNLTLENPVDKKKTPLVFCGYYSRITAFPGFNNIQMTMSKHRKTNYLFSATHSVADKGAIVSNKEETKLLVNLHVPYFVKKFGTLVIYFLQVNKLEKVNLSFINNSLKDFIVHDGPGVLSKIIFLSGKKCICSTFCCTIAAFQTLTGQEGIQFNYSSISVNNITRHHILESENVSLPNAECGVVCILNLTTQRMAC